MAHQDHHRRFPPPWSAEESHVCYIVRDSAGQALAYVYFEEKPDQRSLANLLSKDEARRLAVNFARLSGLLLRGAAGGAAD